MSKFSNALRALRKEHNLTQEKLGELLGISKSSINMYERGQREPNFSILRKIADFFDVDLNFLLGDTVGLNIFDIGEHETLLEMEKAEAVAINMTTEELLHMLGIFSEIGVGQKLPTTHKEKSELKKHFNFFLRISGLKEAEFFELLEYVDDLEHEHEHEALSNLDAIELEAASRRKNFRIVDAGCDV